MDHPQTSDDVIREGLIRRLNLKIAADGVITLPAVPGMLDEYTARLGRTFADLGRPFSDEELAHLRSSLADQLDDAFQRSQRSTVTVTYSSTIAGPLKYHINNHCMSLDEAYDQWITTFEPPLFGTEPDARVWALAAESQPASCRVLDIGGGTGRNALALARRGHPVDVVELTGEFADMIRRAAATESLDVTVIQSDVFEAEDRLRRDYSLILLSEVVPEFRTTGELRRMFELAARSLAHGGRLVFNVFLADDSYTPDDVARQFAQQSYSGFFTRDELASAVDGLPLDQETDDCVFDYEKANLPDGAWPPTSWYAGWTSGYDVFGLPPETCPMDMRWLVYRRR